MATETLHQNNPTDLAPVAPVRGKSVLLSLLDGPPLEPARRARAERRRRYPRRTGTGNRQRYMQEIASTTDLAESCRVHRKLNRNVLIATTTLGLTTGGALLWAPLSYLGAVGIVLVSRHTVMDAVAQWREQRRIGVAAMSALVKILLLANFQFVLCSLSVMLYASNRKLMHTVRDHSTRNMIDVFRQTPREVWVMRNEVELQVPLDSVTTDDVVVVHAGEMIPVDGRIVHGSGEHAGEIESVSVRKSELDDTPSAVTTGPWAHGPADDYLDGSSPRYASIDRPLPLTELGSPYGYGWYRLEFKSGASRKVKIAAPGSGDRLLLALDGEPVGTLGVGPDAQRTMTLSLKRGPRVLTVLADNMGRRADGLGHVAKGLVSPLLEVTPFKLAKPKLAEADPVEPLSMLSPIMNVRDADTTRPERAVWSFTHRKKSQLILEMGPAPSRGLVLLNGTALTFLEPGGVLRRVLSEEPMVKGANTLEFAPLDEGLHDDEAVAALKQAMSAMPVEILEATGELGGTGTWAFAKWEPPLDAMFDELPKTKMAQTSTPSWWRAAFDAADTTASLFIDLKGMTKGQVYLNGHHIARYFVAGADGKSLPPMSRVLLPRTLLRTSGNEVTIFDEHGGNPSKAKLEYAGDQRPLGLTRARG